MSSRRRFILLSFLLLNCSVFAQDGLPKSTVWLIDSALSILDMSRRDCAMRADLVTADNHRLNLVNSFFASPFKTFDGAGYHAKHLREFNADNADPYFTRIMSDCELGVYQPLEFPTEVALADYDIHVRSMSGQELPISTLETLTMSSLMRQYVIPVLKAAQAMQAARSAAMSKNIVSSQCDSLLMMSDEDGQANPFEMKLAEIRSDSVSKLFFEQASFINLERIYSSTLSVYREILGHAVESQTAVTLLRDSVRSMIIESKYGRIAIGGAGNDEYRDDYLMILDVGGDDKYFPSLTKAQAMSKALRVTIDLGGNDVYIGSSYTLGAGVFGGGIVIDVEGNDVYKAGSFSLGAGLFGVGIIHDCSGTDSYSGAVFSQGAGAFGIGLLIDEKGNDVYTVQANGQGFGYTRGFGVVADKAGNDIYAAVSPFVDVLRYDQHYVSFTQGAALGQRPIASGGIGILFDAHGNDTYTCDIYGQGSAYWFGFAALIDEEGEDRYQAYQYAQGAGIHFAHGILWDKKGDDVYVSHGVSQGCGHDVGFGMLLDEFGNDSYVAESLSLGGGNANAVSILADERGDDSYIARNVANCFGFSDFRRNYGMIGIFADGSGTDFYGELTKNRSVATKSSYGVFLDASHQDSLSISGTPSSVSAPPQLVLSSSLDSLFVQASTAPQKYQYMVNPARDRIVSMGAEATSFCAAHLNTVQPRERLALEYLLPKMYDKDTVGLATLCADSLHSKNIATLNLCLWFAGKSKIAMAEDAVRSLLHHSDWRIRAAAAQQLGEAGFSAGLEDCATLLKDSIAMVRMRAAYTIAQLSPEKALDVLRPCMKDQFQLVRNAVAMGLKAHKTISPELMVKLLDSYTNLRAQRSIVRALPALDTTLDATSLVKQVSTLDPEIREAAYREVYNLSTAFWMSFKSSLAAAEPIVELQQILGSQNVSVPAEKNEQVTGAKATRSKKSGKKKLPPRD